MAFSVGDEVYVSSTDRDRRESVQYNGVVQRVDGANCDVKIGKATITCAEGDLTAVPEEDRKLVILPPAGINPPVPVEDHAAVNSVDLCNTMETVTTNAHAAASAAKKTAWEAAQ